MYPITGTANNHSASGNSKFVPQIWSSKLLVKFYAACMYQEIANTDYEGEIKAHGDEVIIRTVASLTIRDYVKGQSLQYEEPTSPNASLKIDQGHYFGFKLKDVDKYQSDLNLMNEWSQDGAEQMKIKVDQNVLGSVYADADSSNAGNTAGAISGNIVLGDDTTPLSITKANILDYLVDYGTCLDENNIPESNRWAVLPAWMCGMIKKSDLKDASLSGDGSSILRTGRIGMIDRLTLYSSNNLTTASGKTNVIFGHKSAITFAGQITEMQEIDDPDDFGKLARSLFVYGFEVIKSESLGHSVVTRG